MQWQGLVFTELDKEKEDLLSLVNLINKEHPRVAYPLSISSLQASHVYLFKVFQGGEWIGLTGYYLKTPTLVETAKTVVFEQYRGQGLGKTLSTGIEEICKSRGFKKIMTTIYSFNIAMISIKLKQGYQIEGFHPSHEAPGFDEYSLGKVLAE